MISKLFGLTSVLVVAVGGCSSPDASKAGGKDSKEATTAPAAKPGEVRVTADKKGFTPNAITLKKDGDGTVTFVRTADGTCATEVVFKELNINKELPLNQPVAIQLPTNEAKSFTFTCGMGMYKSTVTVQ
ncbi:MAG: cupredoxin domain-containing protein [Polyangiaceae bacterium]